MKIVKSIILPAGTTYIEDVEWGLGDDGLLFLRNKNGYNGNMSWTQYDGLSIKEMKQLVSAFNHLLPFI